jgi:threonine dehydrogenase-like Zn-dependent dehydrogenase
MYACLKYRPGSRNPDDSPHFVGAFADYYYLHPNHFVFKVPDELSDEEVAPINCGYSAAMFSIELAGVELGDAVVIQGAGGLGLFATAVAKSLGAGKVISIDGVDARLKLARACGADHTIDIKEYPHPEDRVQRVRQLTQGEGADLLAEFVGLPSVVSEGMAMMRTGGRYVLVGNITPGQSIPVEPADIVMGRKTLIGSGRYNPLTIPKALGFLVRNKDRFPLIEATSHRFQLDDINAAFDHAEWQGASGGQSQIVRAVVIP